MSCPWLHFSNGPISLICYYIDEDAVIFVVCPDIRSGFFFLIKINICPCLRSRKRLLLAVWFKALPIIPLFVSQMNECNIWFLKFPDIYTSKFTKQNIISGHVLAHCDDSSLAYFTPCRKNVFSPILNFTLYFAVCCRPIIYVLSTSLHLLFCLPVLLVRFLGVSQVLCGWRRNN